MREKRAISRVSIDDLSVIYTTSEIVFFELYLSNPFPNTSF